MPVSNESSAPPERSSATPQPARALTEPPRGVLLWRSSKHTATTVARGNLPATPQTRSASKQSPGDTDSPRKTRPQKSRRRDRTTAAPVETSIYPPAPAPPATNKDGTPRRVRTVYRKTPKGHRKRRREFPPPRPQCRSQAAASTAGLGASVDGNYETTERWLLFPVVILAHRTRGS